MARAPFAIHPSYTKIAIAYRNTDLIADLVLPYVPVDSEEFRYNKYTREERYTVPDTKVGRKGKPNQIDFTAAEVAGFTQDYGLEDLIPQKDIRNAQNNPDLDPLGNATEGLMDLILLDREIRVANLVLDPANYAATNKKALDSAASDATASFSRVGSKPITVIGDALDVPLMRPNYAVFGQRAWSILRRHPDILKAYNKDAGDTGMVKREFINELFELKGCMVGSGFVNTARKGQAANMQRVWTDSILLMYRDDMANTQRGTTFGFTARFNNRIAGTIEDPDIGLYGGQAVRCGESVREVISAADLAYLITNVEE
jgi:hypothetical protein